MLKSDNQAAPMFTGAAGGEDVIDGQDAAGLLLRAKCPVLEPGDALPAPGTRTKRWGGPARGHRQQMVAEHLLRCRQAGGGVRPWRQRGLDTVPLAVLGLVRLDSPSLETHKTQPDKP